MPYSATPYRGLIQELLPSAVGSGGSLLISNDKLLADAIIALQSVGVSGYSGYSGRSGFSGFSGYSGTGSSGYSGYSGNPGGLKFTYDSNTASGPSTGTLRGSINPFTSTSTLYVSKTDGNGSNVANLLAVAKAGDTISVVNLVTFASYSCVVSSVTVNANDITFGQTTHAGTGTFTNGDTVQLTILSVGQSGSSGYSGFSGVNGSTGTSGFSGYSGFSGTSGTSGTNGTSGFSGFSGYSGYSGLGTSGTSGYSGYSGFSGYSGYSGYSGRSGYSGFSGFSSKGNVNLAVQDGKLPSSNPARIDGSEQNWRLLFDASTSQSAIWQIVIPQNYGATPKVRLVFSMNATQSGTNAVIWRVSWMKDTPGTDSEDVNTSGFATANSVTATLASNQTAGFALSALCTISNDDSAVAGDFLQIKIDRDAANVSDTATGDAELIAIAIEYTTTS